MAKKKKSDKNFGWTSNKSWNRTDKTHEEKNESAHYSFKLPKKAKPKKLWCQPGDLNTTVRGKREGQKGRPYGYKPIYDADQIYNYQSNSARLNKALRLQPELVIGRILFYRASNDCYWHVVIPPDLSHEELEDIICELPPDFFKLIGGEFWLNYPRPVTPTPGQPLFIPCPEIVRPDYEEPDNPDRPTQPNRPPTLGCMDLTADNFNPAATIDDGSCEWEDDKPPDELCPNGYSKVCKDSYTGDICQQRTSGCTDPEAINFDDCASYEDGSCEYLEGGCIDPAACNYDPNAQVDNGSCIYPPCQEEDPEEPKPPAECIRQPETDCRWVTVSQETALGGGGCSGEFHNIDHGYVELDDGNGGSTYKVLCCGATPPADRTDSYWIDDGNGPEQVTADPEDNLAICCSGDGTWAADTVDGIIASGQGCPKVTPSCEEPDPDDDGFKPGPCPEKWSYIDCKCIKTTNGPFESLQDCYDQTIDFRNCTVFPPDFPDPPSSPTPNPGHFSYRAFYSGLNFREITIPPTGVPASDCSNLTLDGRDSYSLGPLSGSALPVTFSFFRMGPGPNPPCITNVATGRGPVYLDANGNSLISPEDPNGLVPWVYANVIRYERIYGTP